MTFLIIALGLSLVGTWIVLYQMIKAHGRVLLRLDEVEHLLQQGEELDHGQADVSALTIGTEFPAFQLPDLQGRKVGLEEFRGQRVLLIHWSPDCGYCDVIAPDLAALQPALRRHSVQTVLVCYGDTESNRKLAQQHGLDCTILLLNEADLEGFRYMGTPAAYLLDENGRVAEPIALGLDEVPALARRCVAAPAEPGTVSRKRLPGQKDLSQSQIERNGLKPGTPAPLFELPGVDGNPVALKDFRGRRVLLVFSDPHCGPCDSLAPHLVRLHRKHRNNGLAVIVVGRGELEENRHKAKANKFEFPVAVQDHWKLSKQYGIFATPVAFWIGEDGVIQRNVAQGVDEILALAIQLQREGKLGKSPKQTEGVVP
jgi:peroxiredoxin